MPSPPLSPESINQLQEHDPKIKSRRGYKRWKGVCLTLIEGQSAEDAALELGIHPRTVEKHQKRYRDEGLAAFNDRMTGRRGPRLLTAEQEAAFFAEHLHAAQDGHVLRASYLYSEYVSLIGKPCCLTTLYKALNRNGWSKKCLALATPRVTRQQKRHRSARDCVALSTTGVQSVQKMVELLSYITAVAKRPIKLFFQDEARFGRISQPIRCWSPVGKRPVIPSQLIRQYTYAYGARSALKTAPLSHWSC